jgi:hypothetical protein
VPAASPAPTRPDPPAPLAVSPAVDDRRYRHENVLSLYLSWRDTTAFAKVMEHDTRYWRDPHNCESDEMPWRGDWWPRL